MLYVFVLAFQSIAIGYKQQNPASVVVVMAYDSRPSLRIKSSDSEESFRRYRFVDAIQELDPAGALGLMAPDYKVCIAFYLICFIFGFYNLRSVIKTLSFFRLPTALLAEVSLASSRNFSWSFPTTTVRLPPRLPPTTGFSLKAEATNTVSRTTRCPSSQTQNARISLRLLRRTSPRTSPRIRTGSGSRLGTVYRAFLSFL